MSRLQMLILSAEISAFIWAGAILGALWLLD